MALPQPSPNKFKNPISPKGNGADTKVLQATHHHHLYGVLKPYLGLDLIDPRSSLLILLPRFRGVLITGVGNVFCQGVDLHFLCSDHQERRKAQAGLMAAAVERLVLTLSTFPKLLVAAVNGDTTGLGVTLLPLFDIVYANDKATFNTYYSRYTIQDHSI